MTAAGVFMGFLLGTLAAAANCVAHRRATAIDEYSFWACAAGGVLGTLLAVMGLDAASWSRLGIVLIMLAGYFGADVFAALSEERR